MKKSFKKFGVIVLALAMVFALTAVAFAADDTYKGSNNTNATITGTNIPLTKGIVLFNTDGSEIREPNITFTYTVTPLDETPANLGKPLSGVTITDDGSSNPPTNAPVTVNVYNGVTGAFSTTTPLTLSFSESNKVAAAQAGTEVEKTGNLVVDLSAFSHAGVYRFKIVETNNADEQKVEKVGLDARTSDYDTVRYLDVYIKNSTSGLEMYGAVIFKTTVTSGGTPGTDDIITTTKKTTGFEPGKDPTDSSYTYESDNTVDKYHTFNLEVKKAITGGLADKTHDFPFEITLTGDKTANIIVDHVANGAAYDGGAPTTVTISTTPVTLNPKMSDGESVTITGIPVGTTVMVKETNDTVDSYTPSISTQTGFTGLELSTTGALAPNAPTQLKNAAAITDKTQKSVIELTNTLAEVSVTGITLRVAPFAAMAGAGVLFLAISKKSKKEEEDA